jgi:hypothetical protein
MIVCEHRKKNTPDQGKEKEKNMRYCAIIGECSTGGARGRRFKSVASTIAKKQITTGDFFESRGL